MENTFVIFQKRMKQKIKKVIITMVIVLLAAVIIRIAVGEPCYIPSESMEPTILAGDWLWIDKLSYGGKLPERWADIPLINIFTNITSLRKADAKRDWGYHRLPGFKNPRKDDIIVFMNLENTETLLIKRVSQVLHKGDTIYKKPKDSISANIIYKEKLQYSEKIEEQRGHIGYYVLSQNHYYVLGDNYENSRDSRSFGYVPEQFLIGKVSRGIISIEKENEYSSFYLRKKRCFFKIR